ncbi:MAG TPA: SDR family NAD(P)-dependent oxidoreductase [Hyphomicrobiales bacterium]|nr:SDR family NAD(P)-dependent oxidoreductase [Hyphomicrobiales bacterium]
MSESRSPAGSRLPDLLPKAGTRVAVAGGCGGIGRAFVEAAVMAGLDVAVLDLPRMLDRGPPAGAAGIACDATNEASVRDAFAEVDTRWGGLDALVNLVGFTNERVPIEAMAASEWDEIMGGTLRSAFLVCRSAIPLLRRAGGGAIVNTASTFGVRVPHAGYGPYATAKAGIINLTRALATECAPAIRVNALAPGLVDTAFLKGGSGRPEKKQTMDPEAFGRTVPLARTGRPEDMAGPLLFLIGPAAGYITAQTLHVNGGLWS